MQHGPVTFPVLGLPSHHTEPHYAWLRIPIVNSVRESLTISPKHHPMCYLWSLPELVRRKGGPRHQRAYQPQGQTPNKEPARDHLQNELCIVTLHSYARASITHALFGEFVQLWWGMLNGWIANDRHKASICWSLDNKCVPVEPHISHVTAVWHVIEEKGC